MKRILTAVVVLYLILAAGACVFILDARYNAVDVTEVNDAVKTAEENINADIPLSNLKKYGFKFTILDDNETVLYSSHDDAATTVYDAIASGGSSIYFNGGVFLLTSGNVDYAAHIQSTALCYVLALILLSALLCAAYAVYLHKRVIRPFFKMSVFAKNVAGGNFDVPLEMDKDNMFGAFTESFDLMRTELKRAKENERAAAESKKELVASLSHDIKTPLASIKAITELVEIQVQDEDQRLKLKTITQKVEQISLLTDNLFHATLEEIHKLKIDVTERASSMFVQMLRAADYEDKLKSCYVADAIVDCDILRTQQVFDNILCNSYKYAGTGIEADSSITDGFLRLTIQDSGGGVPKDELPFITKKFYRGKNAAGKSGSGIGLYMCDYFMTHMGGYMEVANISKGFAVSLYFKLS